ncbi:MAG: TerC family protein [Steroidobacteraceae bacterium]
MFSSLTDSSTWLAFATLTALETVLGLDNVVFISIVVRPFPPATRIRARAIGLSLAMLARIALLYSIVWLSGLTRILFTAGSVAVSVRSLILAGGGLFLLTKSVLEIHRTLEGPKPLTPRAAVRFPLLVLQIVLIDLLFSFDSIFTAVGVARPDQLDVMIAAIIAAMLAMLWLSGRIGELIEAHPTIKMMALAFLVLIGATLVAESLNVHLPKQYMYIAMVFAILVELVNVRLRSRRKSRMKPAIKPDA